MGEVPPGSRRHSVDERISHSGGRMKSINKFDNLVALGFTASIILAPVRMGIFEVIRPTVLIMLPCAAYLVLTRQREVWQVLRSRMGLCALVLCLLLTIGHILGHDALDDGLEDNSVLSLEAIWVMLVVFVVTVILAGPGYRPGVCLGITVGLAVQIISMILVPPSINYRSFARASGLMHDPNILLIHIIPVFFLWVSLLPRGIWLALAPVGLLPVMWATLQTLSRAGLVSLMAGTAICCLAFILTLRKSLFRLRSVGGVLATIAIVAAFYFTNRAFFSERLDGYFTRSKERTELQGSILEDRLIWWRYMQQLNESELWKPLGVGYHRFLTTDLLPHNTFVDVYVIAGPFAMLLFGVMFITALFKATGLAFWDRPTGMSPLYGGAILAALGTHLLMLNSLSVLGWKVNWLLLGLSAGLLRPCPSFSVCDTAEDDAAEPAGEPAQPVPNQA